MLADVSSCARGKMFGPNIPLHPYFVYASIKDSGQSGLPQPIPWNQTSDVRRGYT